MIYQVLMFEFPMHCYATSRNKTTICEFLMSKSIIKSSEHVLFLVGVKKTCSFPMKLDVRVMLVKEYRLLLRRHS